MSKRIPASDRCCLHADCPVIDCPEPVCAMEFPGGISGYLRAKEIREAVSSNQGIEEAAKAMGMSESQLQKLMKRRLWV